MNAILSRLVAYSLLLCLLLGITSAQAQEEEVDYHFRAFGVEPADRVPFGSGHLTLGLEHSRHLHGGEHERFATPVELTLGLPAQFALMLKTEGGARFSGNLPAQPGEQAERGVALKYSLPETGGLHVAVLGSASRSAGDDHSRIGYGVVMALDSALGTFGAGYTLSRRHGEDVRQGRDFGINWFHLLASGWGLAAETRWLRTPQDTPARSHLLGLAYILKRGVMLDVAVGRATGAEDEHLITIGASYFF